MRGMSSYPKSELPCASDILGKPMMLLLREESDLSDSNFDPGLAAFFAH